MASSIVFSKPASLTHAVQCIQDTRLELQLALDQANSQGEGEETLSPLSAREKFSTYSLRITQV